MFGFSVMNNYKSWTQRAKESQLKLSRCSWLMWLQRN